ncbi:MAG TPA: VWA domain-containing protein [Acidimicrobiia bacterium]|nr:VWA domain-containing protein [Acidimicrobiia bacterium]
MIQLLTDFIGELRAAGIPVSMVESIDAMEAVKHIDIGNRLALKAALGATLVKNARHYQAFDVAFEVFFAHHRFTGPGEEAAAEPRRDQVSGSPPSGAPGAAGDIADLIESIYRALWGGDPGALQAAARRAVEELAGIEPGRPVGGTYYLYRTLRRLDTDSLQQRLLERALADIDPDDQLDVRLAREEVEAMITRLRQEIQDEIRRRLVADRGRQSVARTLRQPLVEDLDLMHATRLELAQIEDVIEPLTRKLAARLARRRRLLRAGRLDFRKTVRRSLGTGGVPLEPIFRKARPHRPEVFLVCDISGSMATFARFTLQFTYAMATHFSKLRSFVFIDTIDEVTGYFGPGVDFVEALNRIASEAEAVWLDGHSDYGNSLARFLERYGGEVTPRTTVIVTGDARNNYRPPRAELLEEIARKSRAIYWLNPEPRSYWDTGDSVMGKYEPYCDGAFEVRTLRQLEHFVEHLTVPGLLPGGGRRSSQLHRATGR